MEIDLLRAGAPMEMTPQPSEAYRVLVARPWERPTAQLWAFNVRDLLPEVPVPLRQGEPEAVIPLGELLAAAYHRARYDLRLDYRQLPPAPSLTAEDAAWAESLLAAPAASGQTVEARRARIGEASVLAKKEGDS